MEAFLNHQIDSKVPGKKLLILGTLWHEESVDQIVAQITQYLNEHQMKEITYKKVPGAFDLLSAILKLHTEYDIILCIGFILKGVTDHYKYTSQGVMRGLVDLTLKIEKPILNGIFNCLSPEQIKEKTDSPDSAKSLALSTLYMIHEYA